MQERSSSITGSAASAGLAADGVAFAPYNAVYDFVKQIPDGKSLYVDEKKTNYAVMIDQAA